MVSPLRPHPSKKGPFPVRMQGALSYGSNRQNGNGHSPKVAPTIHLTMFGSRKSGRARGFYSPNRSLTKNGYRGKHTLRQVIRVGPRCQLYVVALATSRKSSLERTKDGSPGN